MCSEARMKQGYGCRLSVCLERFEGWRENRAGPPRHMKAPKPIGPSFPLRWGRFFWPELGSCRSCAGRRSDSGLFQSALGELDGSSNSWNATSTTASQSSQRKNPASVSTVAGAVWQASHTLHRVHISTSRPHRRIRPQVSGTRHRLSAQRNWQIPVTPWQTYKFDAGGPKPLRDCHA